MTSVNSVLNPDVAGRAGLGAAVSLLLAAVVAFVAWAKAKGRHRFWFQPLLMHSGRALNAVSPLRKSDYRWWALACGGFLVWWLGACLITNAVIMGQYSGAVSQAWAHGGIVYEWNPQKALANGDVGGFDAVYADGSPLPGGQTSLMPYAMAQTDVGYTLFSILNETLRGANLANGRTPFFVWPDGSAIDLTGGRSLGANPGDGFYVNDVLFGDDYLSADRQAFLQSLLNDWMRSRALSGVLFTIHCQFVSLAFPAAVLLSYKRDYATVIAPWASLGGAIALYGGVFANADIHVSAQLVFYDQGMFFGYHLFIVVAGSAWFAYANRYCPGRTLASYLFVLAYVAYAAVAANAFGVGYLTTGLTAHDYATGGSYSVVSAIVAASALTFPGTAALMLFVFVMFAGVLFAAKNVAHGVWWRRRGRLDQSFLADLRLGWAAAKGWLLARWRRAKAPKPTRAAGG